MVRQGGRNQGNNVAIGAVAYALPPGFYVTDLGPAGDGQGEAYQIAAYGSGSTANNVASATVAVVESTHQIQQGVLNRGGL